MDGSLTVVENLGWMDLPVSFLFCLISNVYLIVRLFFFFPPAPMLDFWRARDEWLPTWPDTDARSMIV